MEPLKDGVVPLAQIKERDDADDIQSLHKKEAGEDGKWLCEWRRGKGHDARNEHDRGFNPIAAGLYRYRKAGCRISQDAALSDDVVVEGQNDSGAQVAPAAP